MIVTAIQLAARDRPKAETLDVVLELLDNARGSDLVLLPELWPCGYVNFDRYQPDSEPIDGPLVRALRDQARRHHYHLFTGSFVESEAGRLFNTSLFLDPGGDIVGRYRKMHLFGYQSRERQLLTPGSDVAVVNTPWGRAGLSTCYDLRFPELYRAMIERGAEMFLVTAAWPAARAEAWTLFQRARAHENLACLFSCNMAGDKYAGRSLFVDPMGEVIADAGDEPAVLTREVDLAGIATSRRAFPALADRVLRRPPLDKEHLEFFGVDLSGGWETPAGYPEGIQQKVLAGHIDEPHRRGHRTRLLRFAPGAFTTAPFEHEYWEEVFLVSGTLTVGGQTFRPPTYACRPPRVPHGPFNSDDGCLLFEIHYWD